MTFGTLTSLCVTVERWYTYCTLYRISSLTLSAKFSINFVKIICLSFFFFYYTTNVLNGVYQIYAYFLNAQNHAFKTIIFNSFHTVRMWLALKECK